MTTIYKVSAVDLGTNTLKATHATVSSSGKLLDMEHASETIRLGYGIEATGRIEQQRIDACLAFLLEQERIGRKYGSEAYIGVATEALRIASNGPSLMDRIVAETSWQVEIISGDREAELTYLGLMDQVPEGIDCAIVDIGGGSTEVVILRDGVVTNQQSLAIGSGRLADRFFTTDPPGIDAEEAALMAALDVVTTLQGTSDSVPFVMLAGGSGLFMNQLIDLFWETPPFSADTLGLLGKHLATTPAQDTVDRIGIPLARALVLPASVAVGIAILGYLGATRALGVPSGIRMGLIREFAENAVND
ncbi:MAG: hypothetical protein M9934_09850 [Thermomicrobiales bacterium]|nr:hypothetical protein [Thermomicrobiales bacterium]MCO5228573.1 hypothetical protein [Thermomicrobiales bacterium]